MNKKIKYFPIAITFVILFISFVFILSCKKNKKDQVNCSGVSATYNTDVKPIVTANCNMSACHNSGSSNGDFTSYAGLKNKADNGTLKSRVVDQKNMPPSGALSTDNINKINCWISAGAPNN